MAGTRGQLLGRLSDAVAAIDTAYPVRVAVDGPPAAGKTTLADELAAVLRGRGREVVRATIEDFLFPRAQRYRRGEYSAEGCYLDTHDYGSLTRVLLDPLGPGGDRRYRTAVYDRVTDTAADPAAHLARPDAVLVFDGVFLLRPELLDRWELRILVLTDFDTTVERACVRERGTSTEGEIRRRWRERYVPSQQRYFAQVRPGDLADIVVHNDDVANPAWESRARPRGASQ